MFVFSVFPFWSCCCFTLLRWCCWRCWPALLLVLLVLMVAGAGACAGGVACFAGSGSAGACAAGVACFAGAGSAGAWACCWLQVVQ